MKNQKGISLLTVLIIIVVLLAAVLIFKSISKNGNTENTNNNSSTESKTENKKSSEIVGSWDNEGFVYTFNADGTVTLTGRGLHTQEFTYKIKGNKISLTNVESNATMELEYSINGDKITLGTTVWTKVK